MVGQLLEFGDDRELEEAPYVLLDNREVDAKLGTEIVKTELSHSQEPEEKL